MDCIFCKIVAGEIPCYKIWEDDRFLAFLDIKPINLGHTLLIPKNHAENLFDLEPQDSAKLGEAVQAVAQMIKTGTEADGINLGMNNGLAAGQLVFHAHLHIIPRFEGDGLKHWLGQENLSTTDFETIQEKIQKKASN
jgi:histidine triad (HIT) family protein